MPTHQGDEEYYSGSTGVVTAGATTGQTPAPVDWSVTEFELTVEAKEANTTTTRQRDATTKRTWTRRQNTSHDATGSFSCLVDKSNLPYQYIAPGKVVACEFYINDTDKITGNFYIKSIAHKSGGVEGMQAITVAVESQGTIVLPGDVLPT